MKARELAAWLMLVVAGSTTLSAADDDSKVVARAGDAVVTSAELARRLQALPAAQLASFGSTADQVRRNFLDRVVVPELLNSLEAKQRHLERSPRAVDRTREMLQSALDADLKQELKNKRPVTAAEVRAYFESNKARFEQPLRIRVWRILVDDEGKAQQLLAQAKAAGTPAKWSELAREHSVDKATHLRQGDLGFLHPNGDTDSPRVRIDPAVYRALTGVADGALVPKPVAEAGKFAVLWRRGSLPAKSRTLAQEEASIRQLLERRSVEAERGALLKRLRSESVREEHGELIDLLPDELFGASQRARPSIGPRPGASGIQTPVVTDRGLR